MSESYADKITRNRPGGALPEPANKSVESNVVPLTSSEAPTQSTQPVVDASGKRQYQAYGLHQVKKRYGSRVRFHYGKNSLGQTPVGSMSYSYLTEIYASSNQFLSLVFTNMVVTLEGKNLYALLEQLEEDRVHWVMCFDEKKFAPPAAGETIVTNIVRESLAEFMGKSRQRA